METTRLPFGIETPSPNMRDRNFYFQIEYLGYFDSRPQSPIHPHDLRRSQDGSRTGQGKDVTEPTPVEEDTRTPGPPGPGEPG